MNPYNFVREATKNGESLLSLCAGIGLELHGLGTEDVTAVDIAPQYLEELRRKFPHIKTFENDALEFIKNAESKSVDVISFIDGVEHMTKEAGVQTLENCKRVARKKVLVFTPEGHVEGGYLKNEPHNAWGITGADEYQKHKSGWTRKELEDLGFTIVAAADSISQHNEPYTAIMAEYNV